MLDIVLFIFGVMALGYLARQFGLLQKDAYKPLNDYIYYVSMPALIFIKLSSVVLGQGQLLLLLGNILPVALMMAAVAILWKARVVGNRLAGALLLTSFFGNIVYMGFPIVELRFGGEALASAAIISFVYNFMIFSVGMLLLAAIAGKSNGKYAKEKLLGNTIIISCVAGALVSLSGFALPSFLSLILSAVGGTTAPLALFSLGFFLHGKNITKQPSRVALLCAFKLVLFPALFVGTALLVGLRGQPFQISFLEALMPIAVTNFVIAQKFGLDEELVAQAVLASTLLSLPLLLGFDALLGFFP